MQDDSALEIVDFSVEKRPQTVIFPSQTKIEIHIMEISMFIQSTHLMPMFLALQPHQMMHTGTQREMEYFIH